ncbi:MAG: cupredoxin domain-containing protein [Candidatus Nomurabacteria bacterium]|nr:cupredoxin domain-containing protein [Candidatus Nomurabacteria bacterium]
MKTNNAIYISIIIVLLLIWGAIFLSGNNKNSDGNVNNVSIVDGKQIIEINAKGGYAPRITTAKADIPTVIKMKTNGSFDCSSALVIPSLNYRNNLPLSGETLIDVPAQKSGTKLQGLCAMGMYSFTVEFN